ncbi:DUF374 domain-containing protein [Candidatus Aerophobetes bacterium]|nr:DUF374 domain-containing protein [Candidatus Aerophobetes bacterium]
MIKKWWNFFIQIMVIRIILEVIIKRTVYQLVGREVFLELVLRKVLWKKFSQEVIWHIGMIKSSSFFLGLVMLFVARTSKVKVIGEENLKRVVKDKERVIFVLWHGNYTLLLTYFHFPKAIGLVEASFRGNYISELAKRSGFQIIKTNNSYHAIREMLRMIKDGYKAFITVDGPLGPAYEVKPGTTYLARKSKAKIIPLSIVARRGILTKRWDNHFLPFPFNRVIIYVGKPIEVRPNDSIKLKNKEIKKSLMKLSPPTYPATP